MDSEDALAALPEVQRNILKQFRENVQDILQPRHDDYFLLRWLRARDFDISQSEKMIRDNFKLRKKLNMDEMYEGKFVEPEVYRLHKINAPLGFDKEGCRVRYFMAGFCDFKGFVRSLQKLDQIRVIMYILESDAKSLDIHNRETGLHEQRCVYILDFRDFSIRQVYDKEVLEMAMELIKLYRDNYPEALKVAFAINLPSYILWVWNILKRLMNEVTLRKVRIFQTDDNSWKEELLQIVDPEIIPAFLGGTRCDPEGDPTCQNLVKWTGREIPSSFYLKDKYNILSGDPNTKTVVVRERSYFEHTVSVEKPGSILKWEFQTKTYNINFGIFYQNIHCTSMKNAPPNVLLPVQNVECHVIPENGEITCKKAGEYILHFGNKYSWLTPKHLLYKITVSEPEDTSTDSD